MLFITNWRNNAEPHDEIQIKEVLRKPLETLSPDDRLVLSLLHLEEKSVAEIATLTGWSRPLVKVRAFRARARIRKALTALQG